MNVWTIICLVGTIIFGLLGAVFAIIKEKSAKFFPGYKTIPKHEIRKYDHLKMGKAMRDEMLNWAGILLLGTILSHLLESIYGIIALVLWVIIILVKLFSDPKKELKKHKKY